jgi:hypothetical protein
MFDGQDALEVTPDGKVVLRLHRPWREGTRALCFEPSEFLEKLAVIVPRPRINLLLYHGAFAPRGRCHSGPAVVADAPVRVATPASDGAGPHPEPTRRGPRTCGHRMSPGRTCSAACSRWPVWRALIAAGGCACWRRSCSLSALFALSGLFAFARAIRIAYG